MKKSLLCYAFLLCLSHPLWASNNAATPLYSPNGFYIGGNVGGTFPNIDNNNYLTSGMGWPNDQYHYKQANSSALMSLLGGYTWATHREWLPFYSLGLNYTYVFPSKLSGNINQYSLPEFNNYDFQYKIQRQTLLAILKMDIYRWANFMPFLSLGAGVSVNRAYDYDENAVPNVTSRVSPGFGSSSSTNFSYMIGAGVDLIAMNNFVMGLEYNYGYFGNAKTGYGNNGNSNSRLSTRLNSNTIVLSANYYFDKLA